MGSLAKQLGLDFDLTAAALIWALMFVRIMVVVLLTPFMGTRAVPGRARVAISMVLSSFIFFLIGMPLIEQFPTNKALIIPLFLKEAFFGFTIALVTMMTFYALEAAGRVVDSQRGGGNAQIFLPQLGEVSLFGLFNFWLAISFFLSIGGHRLFIEAFFKSFETMPLLTFPEIEPGFSAFLEFVVRLSGDVLVIAVQLAAPVLIAILLIDIVLGLANKMAPQINVFEMGFAVKGYVGPLMIYVALIVLVDQMDVIMQQMIKSVYQIGKLMSQ